MTVDRSHIEGVELQMLSGVRGDAEVPVIVAESSTVAREDSNLVLTILFVGTYLEELHGRTT